MRAPAWPLILLLGLCACDSDPQAPGQAGTEAARTTLARPQPPVGHRQEGRVLPALPEALAAAQAAGTPIITWTAQAGARLEPCGCVAGMHGGLVRRASLLSRLRPENSLILEVGGWSGGAADYQLLRARYYLKALQSVGCAAVGLGGAEVRLGREKLHSLLAEAPVPTVVCNVHSTDGEALGTSSQAVNLGQRRIRITSVVPPASRGEGLQVSDPAESLLALQAEHPGEALLVLADLDAPGLQALALAVPGLFAVVGGDVDQPSRQPIAAGPCRVVHVANEGKTIGYWPLGSDACHFELIDDRIPDHPQVRNLIHAYQEHLGSMDLNIDDSIGGMTTLAGSQQADNYYVGSATCAACHPNAAQVHRESRHFHSLETLIEKNYHHDPDCLRCHVTGLALPDGFSRREERPGMGMVSCESCHGRGAVHVRERAAGRPASGSLQVVTPAACQRCHDAENSPHFEYHSYWEKIRHDSR